MNKDHFRLAFVSYCGQPWGGSEELWTHTAREALLAGHEVLVSVFDWPSMHPRIRGLQELGAKLVLRRRYYPVAARRLQKKFLNLFLPEGRKTTYHDHLIAFGANHILFSLAGGTEIADDRTDLMVFVRQTRIPFSVMYHSLSPGYVYPDDLAENMRAVLSRSRHSFFTSQFQADLYRRQLGHPIANSVLLSHAVRRIQAFPLPGMDGPIRMCLIGSLVKRWKGQDIAIEALASPAWSDRDWILDIYGTGEDRHALMELVSRNGLSDRIFFRGHEEDVEGVLASHHLVLIPSRQDSGPIVLSEAMQAARTVVGTPMGAMPECLADGVNGFMAESIDSMAFGDALERAWKVRHDWSAIGSLAHARHLERTDPTPQRSLLGMISG